MPRCPDCNSSSDIFGLYGDGVCSHCHGDGKSLMSGLNEAIMGTVLKCNYCDGSGVCQTCGGGQCRTPIFCANGSDVKGYKCPWDSKEGHLHVTCSSCGGMALYGEMYSKRVFRSDLEGKASDRSLS